MKCVLLLSIMSASYALSNKNIQPSMGAKDTIWDVSKEQCAVSSDLTSFTTEKYGAITSDHPMIEVNVNKCGYGYCTNQKVVIKHDFNALPTSIDIAGFDKLWWSPDSNYVLIRRTWDNIEYYVWDCHKQNLSSLKYSPNRFSRVASFICASLGLSSLISYISNVAWHDNNTVVDMKQNILWHINDTKNAIDEIC